MNFKRFALFAVLLLTLGAAYWSPDPSGELVQPIERIAGDSLAPSTQAPSLMLHERIESASSLGLFATPPVVAPEFVPAPPPPPPQAPPLPFRVLGRYVDQRGMFVLLINEQRGFTARLGDVIDDLYEVKAIEGPTMTLIYLPLRQTQTLDIGMPLSIATEP
ncbi:MAG: hypothetical protein WBK19_20425 [Azonexus sp.]